MIYLIVYHTFNREKEKIEFREVENLNKVKNSYSVVPHSPWEMCTSSSSPSILLYQDKSQEPYRVLWLDCSMLPPQPAREITTSYLETYIWRMCCVNDVVVISRCDDGIFAYNARTGELKWREEGELEGMSEELMACGVATDGRGHLFVGDMNNKCIQMFSLDGRYMGALATGTSLGEPWRVLWCENMSSLVILNDMEIGAIKIN